MLTIDEIRDITFRKGRGYKDEDVDAFIDEVIVTFEQLKKDKKDLVRKMDILVTKIEQYRADEETVRNALLNAQKTADTLVNEANAKAAKIVSDAEEKAQKIQTFSHTVRTLTFKSETADLLHCAVSLFIRAFHQNKSFELVYLFLIV